MPVTALTLPAPVTPVPVIAVPVAATPPLKPMAVSPITTPAQPPAVAQAVAVAPVTKTTAPGVKPAQFLPSLAPQPTGVQAPAGQPAPAQPAPPAGGPLPQPRPLPPMRDPSRLSLLGTPPLLGATPTPTAKDIEEYNQFVDGVIDPRNTFDLIEGRPRVVILKQTPAQTQVGDPNIAALSTVQPLQLNLLGRKPGTTVLNLWFTDPKDRTKEKVLSFLVRVLPDPEAKARLEAVYKALEKEINTAFPNSRVCLSLVGDKLMVTGQAHDVSDATQILRILRANAPGQQGQNQNQNQGQNQGQGPGGGQDGGGGVAGTVPLTSITPTGLPGEPLTPGLENFRTAAGPTVINNLRIPGEQQVSLRVTVAEVNRAAARSIGVNWSITNNHGVNVFSQLTGGLSNGGLGTGGTGGGLSGGIGAGLTGGALGTIGTTGLSGSPGLSGVSGGTGVNLPINLDNGQVPILLNALRNLNYARSLAEPNLTAMNGQTATFLAGGQFPVPVLGGFGQGSGIGGGAGLQGVQFVPFGVQLSFTPIITDRDRVRLTMTATVSTRDLNTGASISGSSVPGLASRTFSTTVELREGQTMAVAGRIQNNLGADSTRVPGLGDLPYVGSIFGVSRIQHGEQELVILVTPELVHPMDPHEQPPLPGSDLFEPGDLEFYALGRLESRRSYDYRSGVRTDLHRMLNYRRCEETYIFGASGYAAPKADKTP